MGDLWPLSELTLLVELILVGDFDFELGLVTEETTCLSPFHTPLPLLPLELVLLLPLVPLFSFAVDLVEEVMLAATESLLDLVFSLKLLDFLRTKLNRLVVLLPESVDACESLLGCFLELVGAAEELFLLVDAVAGSLDSLLTASS